VNIEEIYKIKCDKDGWRKIPSGNRVTLGEGVKLGDRVTLGDRVIYQKTPMQIQCHPYIVYPSSQKNIGVGCIVHAIAYWMRKEDPDELPDHPECQPWDNYRKAINFVAESMQKAL